MTDAVRRLADAAAARADVVARPLELHRAGQVDAGRDGFVHHDGVGRQRRLDLRHRAGHGNGRAVPALGGSRALRLGVLRLQSEQLGHRLIEIDDPPLLVHHQHAILNRIEERLQKTSFPGQPLDDRLQAFGVR